MPGLHHISIMASNAQRNADFYTGPLGLRFVKRTVNFDDPTNYHLYYGNLTGEPGTALTFFPWPGAIKGTRGAGETIATRFAIPQGSLDFWAHRLQQHNIATSKFARFASVGLAFEDHDGTSLELIETAPDAHFPAWQQGPVPVDHAIRGFEGVTLCVSRAQHTLDLLTKHMGYEIADRHENRTRLHTPGSARAAIIEVVEDPAAPRPKFSAGSVHHIAFQVDNDDAQSDIAARLTAAGFSPTPVQERVYFRSIYFRERGGVLFEIATNTPGFTVDEPVESLGTTLKLPPWYETHRPDIEAGLAPLTIRS